MKKRTIKIKGVKNMRKIMITAICACLLALVSIAANAETTDPYSDPYYDPYSSDSGVIDSTYDSTTEETTQSNTEMYSDMEAQTTESTTTSSSTTESTTTSSSTPSHLEPYLSDFALQYHSGNPGNPEFQAGFIYGFVQFCRGAYPADPGTWPEDEDYYSGFTLGYDAAWYLAGDSDGGAVNRMMRGATTTYEEAKKYQLGSAGPPLIENPSAMLSDAQAAATQAATDAAAVGALAKTADDDARVLEEFAMQLEMNISAEPDSAEYNAWMASYTAAQEAAREARDKADRIGMEAQVAGNAAEEAKRAAEEADRLRTQMNRAFIDATAARDAVVRDGTQILNIMAAIGGTTGLPSATAVADIESILFNLLPSMRYNTVWLTRSVMDLQALHSQLKEEYLIALGAARTAASALAAAQSIS